MAYGNIRRTQTRVKHTILRDYLSAWGGIIVNGMRQAAQRRLAQGKRFDLHFIYVDCFSYTGRYAGDQEDAEAGLPTKTVYGSPTIGVEVLDELAAWSIKEGVPVRTNSILIERTATFYEQLLETLEMKGMSSRVKETTGFSTLQDREIALVNADATTIVDSLVRHTCANYTYSFYFLDPWGSTGIPLDFVSQIIRLPRHDVMINVPYQDLHKKTGIAVKDDASPTEKAIVRHFDAMFGHRRWREIAQDFLGSPSNLLEMKLVDCYRDTLRAVDPILAVKTIQLRFPDKERTMFYLYLTTHDPSGALKMNRVLWDAGYQEDDLRYRLSYSKMRSGQMSLFEPGSLPGPDKPKRDFVDKIAEKLLESLAESTVTLKDIYRSMADEPYFASEIQRALTSLKRKRLADYETPLRIDSLVTIRG